MADAAKGLRVQLADEAELRLLQPADSGRLIALIERNHDHLMRWHPWVPVLREAENWDSYIRDNLERYARGEGIACGVWLEGQLVGVAECQDVNLESRSTELGYWLAEEHTGKGLATHACEALLSYAFNSLKLNRVVIRCPVDHERSARLAERLGFTREGRLRANRWLNGAPVDDYIYGLLADEWTSGSELMRLS